MVEWRSSRIRFSPPRRGLLMALALLIALGVALQTRSAIQAQPTRKLTSVTVGMGYIPNVQFAPFYVAQARGYYRQAGLDVHFDYSFETDLLKMASLGKIDFVNSGGDEVLTAGAQGLHVKYVLTQYTRFPSALFALQSSGIRKPADLRGKSIGIPGLFGASYVGLLALLHQAGISQKDVTIRSIGFSQVASVAHHKVDAAVGYANNEPIQLRQQGLKVTEFDIYHWANIAGAGIAVGDSEVDHRPAIVRAFVQATLHGMTDTLNNPRAAFRDAEQAVPTIKGQEASQWLVLKRTLDFWRPEAGHALGWVDPQVWTRTARLLYQFHQISHPVSPVGLYTNQFVAAH